MKTKPPFKIILQGDNITETKTSEETYRGNTLKESVTISQCTWKMEVSGLTEDSEQSFSIKKEGDLFVLILF